MPDPKNKPERKGSFTPIQVQEDGDILGVAKYGDDLEIGTLRRHKEGEEPPVDARSVSLRQTDAGYEITDVPRSGPAQIATSKYRSNYDNIFGLKKTPKKKVLN